MFALKAEGDVAWLTLGGSVTIIGTKGYPHDLAPGGNQRFYRIVAPRSQSVLLRL
jgi:hypothetical protein